MKEKMKRALSLLLLLGVLASCLLPLTSCVTTPPECEHVDEDGNYVCDKCTAELEKPGTPDTPENKTYTVVVKSAGGMVMSGVMVYLHDADDPNPYASLGRARTDKNGIATFTQPNDKTYNVEIEGVPTGYKVQSRYTFDATYTANIKLQSAPISPDEEDFRELDDDFYYEAGDIIHDFSLTDINGKSYTVSEVLEESQLLVLNFWYTTCSACIAEFPYLSQAYDQYNATYGNGVSNIVEVFAINDHADGKANVTSFAETNGFNFPSFDAVADNGYSYCDFIRKTTSSDELYYPTTLFIDRYGVICCIEVGGLVNTKYWTNAFDHFTADDYEQKIVESVGEFTVIEKPNVEMPSSDEIDAVLSGDYKGTGNKLEVTYRGETDEYSWPFVIDTFGGVSVVKPSNFDKDNSYATLYADVYLNEGDALAFDYFSSCESKDGVVMIVDKKDIYTITGQSDFDEDGNPIFETCCTYVAQADGWYEVAFVYLKDISDYYGDDTVYIKNLRVIDQSEIETETYIFRYAAFNPDEYGAAFNNYASIVYNPADGYYHVGTIDGPLLLADLLGYTQYDSGKTVFERAYANVDDHDVPQFVINGVNLFTQFEKYGTSAANSKMYGLTPVTEELKTYLIKYVEDYRNQTGWDANENLWLSLCCYYDAYGTNGVQLENPIKGLTTQSAYKIPALDVPVKVTYETILVPRGYLYEFIPETSGVYRVTTDSKSSVLGWIFVGDDTAWADSGSRIPHAESSVLTERFCPELLSYNYTITCPNCKETITVFKEFDEDGNEIVPTKVECHNKQTVSLECPDITDLSSMEEVMIRDYKNVSIAAYLEAGVPYYFAFAFHTVDELGSFEFTVSYETEEFDLFIQASPGPFTFELEPNGQFGSTIADGIKPILCDDDNCADCAEMAVIQGDEAGTKYYHQLNADGTKGYILFADLYQYTDIFQSQSVVDLQKVHAFNFALSSTDRAALILLEKYGEAGLREYWGTKADENWLTYQMDDIIDGIYHGNKGCTDCTDEENCRDHTNFTAVVDKYISKMLDETDHPERQGCVAITAELAAALQTLIDHNIFDDVENAWIKFCFYYKHLGPEKTGE